MLDIVHWFAWLLTCYAQGLIKGYMSHGRRTLVVSKKNPYPALKQVLAK